MLVPIKSINFVFVSGGTLSFVVLTINIHLKNEIKKMKRFYISLLIIAIAIVKTFAYECDIEYVVIDTIETNSYTSFIIEYQSVSADMKGKQMVSGVVTIPSNKKANLLMLDNHYTISSNKEAPSVSGSSSAGSLLNGAYCIAATDYIGYGSTRDQMHPYLCARQNALNSIDIAKVAWKIIEDCGVQLEHTKMINVGYSQGGGVAMAVHREMENDKELATKLHFAGSWCGDGPYDLKATMEEYYANRDHVAYPVGFPMLVNGFLSGAPAELKGDLKFSDFIAPEMLAAGLEQWITSKDYDSDEINKKMKDVVGGRDLTIDDIFSPEMAKSDGTLAKKYTEFAESDRIYQGWTPTYPIRLIHLVGDKIVPVVNAYNAIEGLQLTEKNYKLENLSYYAHASFGMYFYLNLVYELNSFDFNEDGAYNSVKDIQENHITPRPVKLLNGRRIIIMRNGQEYDIF